LGPAFALRVICAVDEKSDQFPLPSDTIAPPTPPHGAGGAADIASGQHMLEADYNNDGCTDSLVLRGA